MDDLAQDSAKANQAKSESMICPPSFASVVITAFNWAEALKLTLKSLLEQTFKSFEIVIADDGSSDGTAGVVKEILGSSEFSWCHVYHDHKGVRQSRIKNLAVSHSRGSYLIFVDQDTILHPDFIHDHLIMASESAFLQGKRVLLTKEFTEKTLRESVLKPPRPWARGLMNRKNSFRCRAIGGVFSRPRQFQNSLRGCNFSLFRSDFLMVDGFDEVYDQSWGREDSDLCYRLFHGGLKVRNLWFSALQYHLYHGKTARWDQARLDSELQRNLREKRVKAIKGLSALSEEGGIISSSKNHALSKQ